MDVYNRNARLYPMAILLLPLVVIGVFYSFEFETYLPIGSTALIVGALSYMLSQLGRDNGKNKEPKLWAGWGGMPSMQLLRHKDTKIDRITKERYHNKLYSLCPVNYFPNVILETANPDEADSIYTAWTKFLISKTRDTKEYNLLFKENISYGFRRNLWGLKVIAITGLIIIIIMNYFIAVYNANTWNPFLFSRNFKYATGSLILLLLFWGLIVTKNWVKIPAFSYAERLCEATERL